MKKSFLTRKEEIVLTTIDLIDELGAANVSIKDISRREKVTDAALYKHFRSKEEIFSGVLEYYMKYDGYIFRTAAEQKGKVCDQIITFFRLYAEYYDNYHAIAAISGMYDGLLHQEEFAGLIRKNVSEKNRFLEELLQKGTALGELFLPVEPKLMAAVFWGAFDKIISLWRLERYEFSLKEKSGEAIEGLLLLCRKQKDGVQ